MFRHRHDVRDREDRDRKQTLACHCLPMAHRAAICRAFRRYRENRCGPFGALTIRVPMDVAKRRTQVQTEPERKPEPAKPSQTGMSLHGQHGEESVYSLDYLI
ncbi:MAG: hypothetical protein RMJ43_00825 [Chloroherpetonaceae bacterium]|nr:hypothetical protein [Chthonomonadaceae bacterium]MDW8206352.1 hypothetical protein [Chloroherpetonaceae bacterium]